MLFKAVLTSFNLDFREFLFELCSHKKYMENNEMNLKKLNGCFRSMKERHENEVQKLRVELDTVKSSAKEKDREYNILR